MSQHDGVIDNAAGATVRADLNNLAAALLTRSSGASAPGTTYADMEWVDTTNAVIKRRNAANTAWIVAGKRDAEGLVAKTAGFTAGLADIGKFFDATSGSWTLAFAAAATLTDGWWCGVRNTGSGTITLDPNSSETIDGATTLTLAAGESCLVWCNGTLFRTLGRDSIAGLTEDTSPDTAADFVRTFDASAAAFKKVKLSNIAGSGLPLGYISGLIQSNNVTDTVNDIDISAGKCRDATDAVDMALSSALTKRLDAAWAVGTNQGGLDTGAEANSTWYALWLIKRSDTGVVDALFSASFSAPTMPASYDYKRLIGAVYNDGSGNIQAFKSLETAGGGLHVEWSANITDVTAARTTTRTNYRISTPPKRVLAHVANGAQDSNSTFQWLSWPDLPDIAPAFSGTGLHNCNGALLAGGMMDLWVITDSSGRIALDAASATGSWYVRTWGYIDHRRP